MFTLNVRQSFKHKNVKWHWMKFTIGFKTNFAFSGRMDLHGRFVTMSCNYKFIFSKKLRSVKQQHICLIKSLIKLYFLLLNCYLLERCPTQFVAPQMFHSSWGRKRSCLDSRRGRISEEKTPKTYSRVGNKIKLSHTLTHLIFKWNCDYLFRAHRSSLSVS